MPLTEFAGGEDFLLGASRAGKQGKRQTYAALAQLRKQEREATQRMLDEQNKARRENPLLGMGQRFKPAGIERTGPKDITIEDYEEGNISLDDYNDLMARLRGQDPRVTRGLRVADMLGLTSAARTLIGKDNLLAGAGGMLAGEAFRRFMPDSKYKYVFDEYGQNVGTGAYATEPSVADAFIAASTVTPARGFGALGRAVRGQASRFAGRGAMPTVSLGDIGGAQGRMSLEEAQTLLEQVPLATKRSGRGTPRQQQTQAQTEMISSKQKLKAEAETNQGKQLTYDLRYTLFDRVKEIDKRAKDIAPDANELKPKKGNKASYRVYTREMKRLLRDAERDFPDFNLNELELSHITPLTQGGSNTWSNLRLMPRQLNQDQSTALYSAWRYASMGLLDPSKVAKGTPLGGARGSAAITGRLAEGIG